MEMKKRLFLTMDRLGSVLSSHWNSVRKRERVGEMKRETDIEIERNYAYFYRKWGKHKKKDGERERETDKKRGRERE